jgi:hypothetical protein
MEQFSISPDAQKVPIIERVERVERILTNPENPYISVLEAEINRLVYALCGLTEDEIAVVEGKK